MGCFGQQLVPERPQPRDRRGLGHSATIVRKRRVDALSGELGGDERHLAQRSPHDHPHIWLVGAHVRERVHAQDRRGQRRHLVGGHHPRTHAE